MAAQAIHSSHRSSAPPTTTPRPTSTTCAPMHPALGHAVMIGPTARIPPPNRLNRDVGIIGVHQRRLARTRPVAAGALLHGCTYLPPTHSAYLPLQQSISESISVNIPSRSNPRAGCPSSSSPPDAPTALAARHERRRLPARPHLCTLALPGSRQAAAHGTAPCVSKKYSCL
jgi:hypothetical protein